MRAVIVILVLSALAAACSTAPRAPRSSIGLTAGEGATIEIGGSGARVLSRTDRPTVANDVETAMMAGIRENPAAMGENVMPSIGVADYASEAVEPNRLKLRFLIVPPHDSVLMIENGYDQAFSYRATIIVNDRSTLTDVCLVLPSRHGVEHWPYLIDHIELSELALQPWSDGDPLPCR